jgi:hypothetical protein
VLGFIEAAIGYAEELIHYFTALREHGGTDGDCDLAERLAVQTDIVELEAVSALESANEELAKTPQHSIQSPPVAEGIAGNQFNHKTPISCDLVRNEK